jgi:hypothetical protein
MRRERRVGRGRLAAAAVAAAAIAALLVVDAVTLTRVPCLGIADNLDYWRVMRPAGIERLTEVAHPGAFVDCDYRLADAHLTAGFSSSALFAYAATRAFRWMAASGQASLRQVGLLYLAVVVLALACALWVRLPALALLLLLYVVSDAGYLLFFNSFYADPAQLVAIFAAVMWLWWWGRRLASGGLPPRRLALACAPLVGIAAAGGLAKMQYVLFPAVLGATLLLVLALRHRFSVAYLPAIAALALVSALAAHHFYRGSGYRFLFANNYHAVFAGLLTVTDDDEAILEDLGISEEFWSMPRRDVFSARVPFDHPVLAELATLSRSKLLGMYLARPSAVAGASHVVAQSLIARLPHKRGNFVRSEEHPRRQAYAPAWQFSALRARWLLTSPARLAALLVASFVAATALLARGSRGTGVGAALLFLLLWAMSQIVVAVLGDGFVAIEQHLVAARLAIDFAAVLLLWALMASLPWLWRQVAQARHGPRRHRAGLRPPDS